MSTHFTGIKGTGMAALAEILHDGGEQVQGSDIEKYVFTEEGLKERGIPILPFDPENIHDGDTVIVGLSFGKDHPEAARALSLPNTKVYWYNEYLGKMLEGYESVCVAGCHGKSTTTGLLASIFNEVHPTGYLIGDGHGHMPADADRFVLESCEFQRHFLAYHPDYALITNIELDHVDYYKDLDDYISAFQSFVHQVKKGCIVFGDDPYLPHLDYQCKKITYGLNEGNDYQGINLEMDENGIRYDVLHEGEILAHVDLPENGMPIVWDSLGAFAMAHVLGEEPEAIVKGLKDYNGISRRFVVEEAGDSILVDDYAHHPTAIQDMIDAVRIRFPGRKVIAVFKPDRYTRLQYFLERFAGALASADEAFVLDFDATAKRENDSVTVTIQDLVGRVDGMQLLDISDESAKVLEEHGPAVYLFMSSKNIYLLKDLLKNRLNKNEA